MSRTLYLLPLLLLTACYKPQPAARYQVAPAGDRAVLLDTATAQTWVLDLDKSRGLVWMPLPPPAK